MPQRLAAGKDFSVYYSVQSAYGAINASPAFTPVRRSSGKPKRTISYTQSDTVTTDSNASPNVADTQEIMAEIETNAAKQTIDFMISAIHGVETDYTNTQTTFAALADGFTVPAATYAALSAGDGFWISGFVGTSINGFYIVASKEASNKIVTTIAPAATEAAGASVTIVSNKTKNADTTTYYALQRRTVDQSAAGSVSHFTTYDNMIDTQSLAIAETGQVKSSIAFRGEQYVPGTAAISGQTTTAIPTDEELSAVKNILGFYVDGAAYVCKQKSMTINIGNGYSGDDAAGCQRYYARGQFTVGLEVSMRSRIDNTLDWEAVYLGETRKSIGVLIKHSATDQTYIVMPRCVVTEHNQEDAANTIASHVMTLAAEGDSTTASTIQIFRNW